MENDKKLAVLIDADNVSPKYMQFIFAEAVNHGTPTYKRIYGDWTQPQVQSWKEALLEYSVTPVQQYSYTTGKNSTDSALIIDAMDILYSNNVDGFCIVSSDSDFTRLATRLRESGMYVIGIGETKTPKPFVAACERFRYLESLVQSTTIPEKGKAPKIIIKGLSDRENLIEAIVTIIKDRANENGWVFLAEVGAILNKRFPDFDSRNYGYDNLSTLIQSMKVFELDFRKTNNPHVSHIYVKNKQ